IAEGEAGARLSQQLVAYIRQREEQQIAVVIVFDLNLRIGRTQHDDRTGAFVHCSELWEALQYIAKLLRVRARLLTQLGEHTLPINRLQPIDLDIAALLLVPGFVLLVPKRDRLLQSGNKLRLINRL